MLLYVVYALPFIHVFPYIWFNFDAESPTILWGSVVNPYMTNKSIIELMSMIGAVGAAGFAAGASLLQGRLSMGVPEGRVVRRRSSGKTLSLPAFVTWIVIGILLTWISAPADTVFTAAYTESKAIDGNWNFASAWMFSYAFMVFALADSMFEPSIRVRKVKLQIFVYAVLLIVIWFQLLRGNRESLPFVLAALLMYYVWGRGLAGAVNGRDFVGKVKARVKLNWPMMSMLVFVVLVAAYFVGALRHSLTGVSSISGLLDILSYQMESGGIRIDYFITGTWSAALLTPLSVAGDYINDSLALKYGQTYLDLLASTVPGFVADWIGYTRPIDALQGPAWDMRYGIGGTHAVVVPFINFRMAGVFIIVALWSFAFAKIERHAVKRLTVSNLALLGIIAMASPHWLWYGEKSVMSALIIWLVLSVLYRARLNDGAVQSSDSSFRPSRFSS